MQSTTTRDNQAEQISRVIFEHAARISKENDPSKLLVLNADLARDLVRADRASIWLIDEKAGELVTRVAHGVSEIRIPLGSGIVGSCVATNQTIVVNDTSNDERFLRRVDNSSGYKTNSVLAVPLCVDGSVIGALQLLNKPDGFSSEDAELLRFTALYSAAAINAERMRREAEAVRLMRHELDLAREVQRGLLPQDLPPVRGIEYAGICRPARSVGGDYYDFLELPGDLFGFILGDVSGKGIPAAVLMASIQTLLRSLLMRDALPVSHVMNELNTAIHRCSSEQFFTTLFSAVLNADRTALTYVNAGHIPLMVLRAGPEERIDRTTLSHLPISILPEMHYQDQTIDIGPGDLMLCISDGISEVFNSAGQMWEDDRIEDVLRKNRDRPVEEIVNAVVAAVDQYAAGVDQFDDMTLVVVRVLDK
jgi:sigma-B regulation protein RsbU (phosphoserine phosphatase)